MNNYKTPCYQCTDRQLACSDHCEKPDFLAWREKMATASKNRRIDKNARWATYSGVARGNMKRGKR